MTLTAGTRLGRYELRSLLGAGGMGEVYLALDTELGRPVALKFLPAEMASDPRRMSRFEKEARTASALNHPNIVTVYDIGQTADGRRFIATELVEGVTLRERMREHRPKLGEVLDIAAQVADAHARGVVHRDVKPENVMLRRDGYVKILDFGLAKLTGRPSAGVDTEAATRSLVVTDAGAVMGTVSYMSPEQARGEEVDARTDVWSLGVLLYEMLTGHLPFRGRSASHTLVAIQDAEPPPLSAYLPEAPDLLQEVVSDALSKDREARLTAKQMLAKLKRLGKRLESGAQLDHPVAPDSGASGEVSGGATASQPGAAPSVARAATLFTGAGEGRTTEPDAAPRAGAGPPRRRLMAGALAVVALAALGYGVYRYIGRERPAAVAKQMKISRLITGAGNVGNASISPDGRYVAYSLFKEGKSSLRVRQVSTGSDREIVAPAEDGWFNGTAFSPDGELVYYKFSQRDRNPLGTLYQVPVIGGREPKRILDHLASVISFAPDGKRFAFVRVHSQTGESALMVASLDGGEPRALARRGGQDWFGGAPAWSPDGRRIVCPAGSDAGGPQATLVEVPAEGGAERVITPHRWRGDVFRPVWLKDGSGLVVNASELPTSPYQIWHVSYPDGAVTRITNDLTEYGATSFGITDDASTIVTAAAERSTRIWLAAPNEDEARARRLTDGKYDGQTGIDWTPDGRLVYVTKSGDSSDIWIMNADGSGKKQLTADANDEFGVRVSPDGRHVVFAGGPLDRVPKIFLMGVDGGEVKQLTRGEFSDFYPFWSPDGQWVFFGSWRTGNLRLWKVPAGGGEPSQVSDLPFSPKSFVAGGSLIFGDYFDEQVSPARWRSALLSADDARLVKVFDFPPRSENWKMPDERALLYAMRENDTENLWTSPLEGGTPKQLTRFTSEEIFTFALTRDGKQFAVVRGTASSDIILIKDFR